MQNMKKKACDSSNSDKGDNSDLKQKERHIVSWSEEDDDTLREQISIHGTNNWAIIASKFENKTTRQCRRRWFTYLNSDFKKGGWSQEEDKLLYEAQKIYGNRWTEIAKVVSGRTDNAVKNRFSILCKKRAKHDTSTKENNGAHMNTNNKRTRQNTDKILETSMQHMNIRRKHIVATMEDCKKVPLDESRGKYLKKDDPKIVALMQQAKVLDSLAIKVSMDKRDQSLKDSWKVIKDFLKHSKESDVLEFDISNMKSQLEKFKDLLEEKTSCHEGNQDDFCDGRVCPLPNSEFNSPLQVTPLFRSMAEGIPTPQFSESERSFLLKTLGMESTIPIPTSQSPPCKRALLHCL